MSSGPIELTDETGAVRFKGTAKPPPGGGSTPVQGVYNGLAVTIADQAGANLTWDHLLSGTELLDRTDPANPLLLASGAYAVTAQIVPNAVATPGGYYLALLQCYPNLNAASGFEWDDNTLTAIAVVDDITQALTVSVDNFDGASSRNFTLAGAVIVKLA